MRYVFFLIFIAGFLNATRFYGNLESRYYALAESDTTLFHSFYNRFNFGMSQILGDKISLFTSFYIPSVQKEVDKRQTDVRLFSGYLNISLLKNLYVKIGRQFTPFGFGNIYDGLSMSYDLKKLRLEVYGGFKSPYDHEIEIQDSSYVAGFRIHSNPLKNYRVTLSYNREWMKLERDFEEIYLGNYLNLKGFKSHLKLYYDLISNEIHRLYAGTAKNFGNLIFYLNFLDYRPSFSERFFISGFEIGRKRFLSSGAEWNLWKNLWAEADLRFNFVSDTSSAKEYAIGISLKPWISAGLRLGNGYQLDENFYYANLTIPFKNALFLYGSVNYHTYEIYEEEEAFSWRAGLKTGYFKNLKGQIEVQEFVNEEYNYDYRFLFSLTYKFRGRL